MTEFGIFNDEGMVEGQFYSADEAAAAQADRYSDDDGAKVAEVCPDHEEQPRETCEDCFANEDDVEPDDAGVSNLALAYVILAALVLGAAAPAGTAAFGLVAVAALAVLGLFGVRAAGAAGARRGGGSR